MTDIRTRTLRILLAGAMSLGVLGTATAAHALTPPAPHQGGVEIAQPGPDDPTPPAGPDDLTSPEPECNPILASCDLAPNPTVPDDGGSDGSDGSDVDDAVVAHPTFTG